MNLSSLSEALQELQEDIDDTVILQEDLVTNILPSKKLQFSLKNNGSYNTIKPYFCHNCSDITKPTCKIITKGSYSRFRVYDIKSSIELIIEKLHCFTHKQKFSTLDFLKLIQNDSIIPYLDQETFRLVIFDRVILTLNLFENIIHSYLNIYNYEKISRLLYVQ